jgi:hypothetical protein
MVRSKSSDSEERKDIAVLQAYRQSRVDFNLRVVEASKDQSDGILAALRSDSTYQLAEFYYLLRGFKIRSAADLDQLIDRHNDYVSALLSDKQKMNRMGLSSERLLSAIFDGETKPRVLKIWADEPGALDQSSLARLLVAVMSDETARRTIVACASAGFFLRHNSIFRITLVKSTGTLEDIFGSCLRSVRQAIEAAS